MWRRVRADSWWTCSYSDCMITSDYDLLYLPIPYPHIHPPHTHTHTSTECIDIAVLLNMTILLSSFTEM